MNACKVNLKFLTMKSQRRNNECHCARTEDVNARLVNGGQSDKD